MQRAEAAARRQAACGPVAVRGKKSGALEVLAGARVMAERMEEHIKVQRQS